jgi:ParB family chromosome partitioning protein
MSRKALGKGLSALIPDKPLPVPALPAGNDGVREVPVQNVYPNPHQPRKDFAAHGMEDLVRSVKKRGVIQPVLVRESKGGFQLIAGERRWRAARQAGMVKIPVIVRKVSDQDSLELALIENLQRENLNPMEAAEAYERLLREFNLTQDEVARQVGKQRSSVANALRLLALPVEVQDYVRQGKLSAGHAKAILSLSRKPEQTAAAREILRRGLSVREAEALVRKTAAGAKAAQRVSPVKDIHLAAVENELKRHLGTQVRIHDKKDKGKIEIEYYSKKERERLIVMLRGSAHI